MNNNTAFKALVLLGEALLITAFLLFRGETPTDVFVLRLVVSSVVYMSFFIDLFIPLTSGGDKAHKAFGGLGPRWFCVGAFALASVAAMLYAAFECPWGFKTQLCIHLALLLLLGFGLVAASSASQKVAQVHEEQLREEETVERMRRLAAGLVLKAQTLGVSQASTARMEAFKDNTRFLSPTNNPEAKDLDEKIIRLLQALDVQVEDEQANRDSMEKNLAAMERLHMMRKTAYSV